MWTIFRKENTKLGKEKNIKGDAFYYIHINEFLEQEDDRTNLIIKTLQLLVFLFSHEFVTVRMSIV